MASGQTVISSPAVLDTAPDADEFGVVARVAGTVTVSFPPLPDIQQRFDISSTVIYVGYAQRGVADATVAWTIKRIQFTSGNPTTLQWTDLNGSSWTNRAAATYT